MSGGISRKILGAILICFLFGCGSGMRALREEERRLDLVVNTYPPGADVFVNSDYIGKSPAKAYIPCKVFIQEKGARTFTTGSMCAATMKNSLGILGYGLCAPAAVLMWPYGLLAGAVIHDKDVMLLPITVMKRIPEVVDEMKQYYERAERTRVVRVVPADASAIELSAEWNGKVGRRNIDLGWFIKDPVGASSGGTHEITLILDTDDET